MELNETSHVEYKYILHDTHTGKAFWVHGQDGECRKCMLVEVRRVLVFKMRLCSHGGKKLGKLRGRASSEAFSIRKIAVLGSFTR